MKILITGASGLIGGQVAANLRAEGHELFALRRPPHTEPPWWDPAAGTLELGPAGTPDAVIHLAGANIASGRWTAARKAEIRDSRLRGTELLARTLATLPIPPKVLLCASAIGFYGDRGETPLDEASASGEGFLAEVCRDWEGAATPAVQAGIRTVFLRTGIVLAREGGALPRMLPPFRMGAGGSIGTGHQVMSWIHINDLVAAIRFILTETALQGPVNLTAPGAVTNATFTRTLGNVLKRPTILPLPAFAVRLLFGAMGEELLLSGARVEPAALTRLGFRFHFPNLEPALRNLLQPA